MSQTEQYNFFTGYGSSHGFRDRCRLFRCVNWPMSNRCSVEQHTFVTSNGLSTVARFNFEAFRFVQHRNKPKSSIYVHCILRLCEPSKCQELLSVSKKKKRICSCQIIRGDNNEITPPQKKKKVRRSIELLCVFRPAVTGGRERWLRLGDKAQILPRSPLDLFTQPTKVRSNKQTNPVKD